MFTIKEDRKDNSELNNQHTEVEAVHIDPVD